MKNIFTNYYKPTPAKWRKIGDSILVIGTITSTTCLVEYEKAKEIFGANDLKTIMLTAVVCTALGKIITNFASENTNIKSEI
jgi:hypothetical protein